MIKLQCKDRQRDRQIKNYIYLVYKQNQVLVDQTFPNKKCLHTEYKTQKLHCYKEILKIGLPYPIVFS